MGYIGTCRCETYGFQAVYSKIGYINQSVWFQNRVSFFRKLISWLKILSRLGKQLLQDKGILGSLLQYRVANSAELALVQVKGSTVSAAHPHPEIPKVPPGQLALLGSNKTSFFTKYIWYLLLTNNNFIIVTQNCWNGFSSEHVSV